MIVIPEVIINILLIIFAVLLFEFIILSHEFGHFITAKLSGIRVNEFALGMGPKLIHFKRGETEYSLRAFPIGGFCAMEGEDESSDDPRAFGNKAVWKRILVVVAGAVMNILLGAVLMMVITGQQSVFSSTTVAEFTENSLTKQSGLRAGDEVVSINGYRVYTEEDMQRLTIIRSLRCANYSLSSILRMLNALSRNPSVNIRKIIDTPGEDDDIITACDKLLTSLAEAKENAGYVESQIGKLIEMNRRNSCERQL